MTTMTPIAIAAGRRIVAEIEVPFGYPRPSELRFDAEFARIAGEQIAVTALERPSPDLSPRSDRERDESLDFILGNAPIAFYTTDRESIITFNAGKALAAAGVKAEALKDSTEEHQF